jgi:cytidine deaminase
LDGVSEPTKRKMLNEAIRARERAYSPYSGVKIGAAVLNAAGKIYAGCNIENISYSLSNCAERTAIFKAASDGRTKILAITIVGENEEFTKPCGACRQVLIEFNPKMLVIRRGLNGFLKEGLASDLLPDPFKPPGLAKP